LAKGQNVTLNNALLKRIISENKDWNRDSKGRKIGLAYDGKSSLYSTKRLQLARNLETSTSSRRDESESFQCEVTWPIDSKSIYVVIIGKAGEINVPKSLVQWKDPQCAQAAVQALDIALLSFARWSVGEDDPKWILAGNKAFRSDGITYNFSDAYIGRLGYYSSLKSCFSGLVLVVEVSVACFIQGGPLIELMACLGKYRDVDDMYNDISNRGSFGLRRDFLDLVERTFKGAKIKIRHLNHTKSLKAFGKLLLFTVIN
jgi:hypothetical protein